MITNLILIVLGLAILIAGAEGLVRGSSSLAAKLKIAPLVIGLTVVAFGTSTPELTVNILSVLNGSPDLAIGNVIGSNIANILLILGISAMIIPLSVKSSTVWKEIPLALLGVVLVLILGNDAFIDGLDFNALTRSDGLALIALMVIFMYYIFGLSKTQPDSQESEGDIKEYRLVSSVLLTFLGLGGLIWGGKWLVDGAIGIAETAGLSESLIGLTIVGVGTSLPELATSVVAALRKQTDIAIGNVVGSNIFNVFFILGTTSLISPLPFNSNMSLDVLVAVAATALLFVVMFLGKRHRLERWEGMLFLGIYLCYVTYLVIQG